MTGVACKGYVEGNHNGEKQAVEQVGNYPHAYWVFDQGTSWRMAAKNSASNPPVVNRWRSAVSNGKRLFADQMADGRSAWARRLRDVMVQHITDLGGEEAVSAAERSICRRIATITTEMELLEKRFALSKKGGASADDFDLYLRAANSLRRLLETIGLQRRSRDVTSLSDYLRQQTDTFDDEDTDAEDVEVSP
jgi:hypothetical protein